MDAWIIAFAHAAELAVRNAVQLADDIRVLNERTIKTLVSYREAAGISPSRPRADAVSLSILGVLATDPVLTVDTVATRFNVSTTAAHRALTELADAGILARNKDQKGRLICWTADHYLALVARTERNNHATVHPPK